jgi:hypothetical protein
LVAQHRGKVDVSGRRRQVNTDWPACRHPTSTTRLCRRPPSESADGNPVRT